MTNNQILYVLEVLTIFINKFIINWTRLLGRVIRIVWKKD